jgi:hypothetical protein
MSAPFFTAEELDRFTGCCEQSAKPEVIAEYVNARIEELEKKNKHLTYCMRREIGVFMDEKLPEYPITSTTLPTDTLRRFNAHYTELSSFVAEMLGTTVEKLNGLDLMFARTRLAAAEEALSFYADKLNWDSEEIIPTCWDEGSIDLGRRASAYFLSYPKEPGDKP